MSITLVALTELDPQFFDQLLDGLAAVFPVVRRNGWPGVWFVEVDQRGPSRVDDACEQVAHTLDDLHVDWRDRVKIQDPRHLRRLS
jgi:hypothetical protein